MTEQQSIRDELAQAIRGGFHVDGPADDEDYAIADAVLASPVIRRIQAQALRDAAKKMRPWLMGDGSLWERLGDFKVHIHGQPHEWLPVEADRIEKGNDA